MARRRRPAVEPLDFEPPEWLLRPPPRPELPFDATGYLRARREWRAARDVWLRERGLVVWSMAGLSWADYRRIEREESHRIVRHRV